MLLYLAFRQGRSVADYQQRCRCAGGWHQLLVDELSSSVATGTGFIALAGCVGVVMLMYIYVTPQKAKGIVE